MNTNKHNEMTEARLHSESCGVVSTGLAPDYEEQPSAFAMDGDSVCLNLDDTPGTLSSKELVKIDDIYMTNRLCDLVELTSSKIGELAKRVACGVVLTGWMVGKAKMANPRRFGKMFGVEGFSFSQQRGNQFMRCAAAVLDRATAAGIADDFVSQVEAALAAYRENPNIIPELPVLDALESDKWVSVHAMMLELGVVRPAKIRQLPQPQQSENSTPALPGLEELCAQHWSTASKMLDSFHYFMQQDAGNLNKQQRTELREQLHELLAELDRLEATAPALM